jgi:hypothetical protein
LPSIPISAIAYSGSRLRSIPLKGIGLAQQMIQSQLDNPFAIGLALLRQIPHGVQLLLQRFDFQLPGFFFVIKQLRQLLPKLVLFLIADGTTAVSADSIRQSGFPVMQLRDPIPGKILLVHIHRQDALDDIGVSAQDLLIHQLRCALLAERQGG